MSASAIVSAPSELPAYLTAKDCHCLIGKLISAGAIGDDNLPSVRISRLLELGEKEILRYLCDQLPMLGRRMFAGEMTVVLSRIGNAWKEEDERRLLPDMQVEAATALRRLFELSRKLGGALDPGSCRTYALSGSFPAEVRLAAALDLADRTGFRGAPARSWHELGEHIPDCPMLAAAAMRHYALSSRWAEACDVISLLPEKVEPEHREPLLEAGAELLKKLWEVRLGGGAADFLTNKLQHLPTRTRGFLLDAQRKLPARIRFNIRFARDSE